ncbi:MAG: metal ABC transporter permease [Paracoccaceae bacterium]|jgi:manganese/iron transport system permease protein|nr:metal ABC transporter permease [Paracoccaceae bacterium]
MIDTLLMPFQFGFMQNAFLIGLIVSIPAALLSSFLVLKGWALMGDAVSHAVLPGIVLAYIVGFPFLIGAFAAGMFCALATGYLSANSRVKQDTVMGVVFSGMFGLGIVMFVSIETDIHLDHVLFGNMMGVGQSDYWTALIVAGVVASAVIVKRQDLLLHAFDPAQAQASGLRVNWLHYGLLAALSLTVVALLSSVGLILAIGLLIAPGAIAFLVTRRFGSMLIASVVICEMAMFGGTYLSFFIDSAPAPTVVLVLTAMFIAAFIRKLVLNRRTAQMLG